jgi:hypothetical protein
MRINFCCKTLRKFIEKINKFNSVLAKNDGFQKLKEISNILSLDATDKDNNDLDPEYISSLKYAPNTSVDVERTFSTYKNILSDRRQKFSVQNLEKHLIINWYINKLSKSDCEIEDFLSDTHST